MAADLDAALEPGETIVYRTRGRIHTATAFLFGTIMTAVVLFWSIDTALRQSQLGPSEIATRATLLLGGCIAMTVICVLIARRAQRRAPDDLMITERRLLFANSDWDDRSESMALTDIEQITWASINGIRRLTVKGAGRAIRLPQLRDGNAAASALARATGLTAPPALGPISVIDPIPLFMVPGVLATYLILVDRLALSDRMAGSVGADLGDLWVLLPILLLDTAVLMLVGIVIAAVATLTVIRAFKSFEDAEVLLCAGKPDSWHLRLVLATAGLFYGKRLSYRSF